MVLYRAERTLAPTPIFMTDLIDRLERLGLTQYFDSLVSEGFDSWETILDITESDLYAFSPSSHGSRPFFPDHSLRVLILISTYLNFKLGHRRVCNPSFLCMLPSLTTQ